MGAVDKYCSMKAFIINEMMLFYLFMYVSIYFILS